MASDTLKVRAAHGLRVPMENNARRYIEGDKSQDVPRTAYYLRRIADGDLLQDAALAVTATPPAATGKKGA